MELVSSATRAEVPQDAPSRSSSMSVDHKVDFRSEEALARFANDLRRRAYKKGKGRYVLDIIDLIERVLAEYFAPRGGLRIDVFDGDKFDEPACVTYRPQLCIFGEI